LSRIFDVTPFDYLELMRELGLVDDENQFTI
jgi:hypothetical protein